MAMLYGLPAISAALLCSDANLKKWVTKKAAAFLRPGPLSKFLAALKLLTRRGSRSPTSTGGETRADADTAKVLTMDEARRIAANLAKLPTYLSANPKSESE
jgi:hypothetical protein